MNEIKFTGKYSDLITTYFSNSFEIYVDNIKEWKSFISSLEVTSSLKAYDNKIIFSTIDKIESNELMRIIFCSQNAPKSNFSVVRKILEIEEIFK